MRDLEEIGRRAKLINESDGDIILGHQDQVGVGVESISSAADNSVLMAKSVNGIKTILTTTGSRFHTTSSWTNIEFHSGVSSQLTEGSFIRFRVRNGITEYQVKLTFTSTPAQNVLANLTFASSTESQLSAPLVSVEANASNAHLFVRQITPDSYGSFVLRNLSDITLNSLYFVNLMTFYNPIAL